MVRWLRRLLLLLVGLAGLAAALRWLLNAGRRDRVRSGVAPTIGGDTWPPVPVNAERPSS